MRSDSLGLPGESEKETALFIPTQPREKWLKKRTSVKLKVRYVEMLLSDLFPHILNNLVEL